MQDDRLPTITVRVPGPWRRWRDLAESLPAGCVLEDGFLRLEGGDRVPLVMRIADKQLPALFEISARVKEAPRLRQRLDRCPTQACVVAPGGSDEAARRVLAATAALARAGGEGLYVDNSGLTSLPEEWLQLADSGQAEALVDAFVNTFGSDLEFWSLGMHALGLRDVALARSGDDANDVMVLRSILYYIADPEVPIVDGDFIGEDPTYRFRRGSTSRLPPGSSLHNPYGEWHLERVDTPIVE
jgi:hypothetical protein